VIELSSEVSGDGFSVGVKDQGIGISSADQEHLFSSFFRAANAMNIQGTGLGLHLVKRYTDLMQGTINLQSELNKGTLVTIFIPITG
jgi:signal transduction histidine kinase